jgi:predicted CoA-substrate-specific enzyme activase
MMANKILELLKRVEKKNCMIVGGSTRNQMMMSFLKDEIPGLIIPESAPYFEALGTAIWAMSHETKRFTNKNDLFNTKAKSFKTLPPLRDAEKLVTFKSMSFQTPQTGDVCIVGLDVGSTTTKAVLVRKSDDAVLASIYRMTEGDPVGASRKCYQNILDQIAKTLDPAMICIEGLGICGSGRQIAGLHAMTDGIINEIIAHAAAAVHFDPDVDTIFEIGGQDAKYTYITAGVPSDYAMNEACSAGTGSFLEESAHETLGITVNDIAQTALNGENPPNFNDQCAAFISSDIKTAIHEGIKQNDIVAGLVYSICMNYNNRVKGNRPLGRKVFMQGGVCYNQAVPLAMAALSGKTIIVPPEPGLMGAYGAALEIKRRISLGLIEPKQFDLQQLAQREVQYGKSFFCPGGSEKCDRHCEINVVVIDGKKFSFGGACNRYYNLRHHLKYDISDLDLVKKREDIVFQKYACDLNPSTASVPIGSIGINKSFQVNTLYPLYHHFFAHIGLRPVFPDKPTQEGIDRRNAAFCYPAELTHGFFDSLIKQNPPVDFIFLPHLRSIPVKNGHNNSQICPFAQGEPFYLKTAFKQEIDTLAQKGTVLLTPLIDMKNDFSDAKRPLIHIADQIGVTQSVAEAAFSRALEIQYRSIDEMKSIGFQLLENLKTDPDKFCVVIFGRPYNAMVQEAHMGIPHKFATRGIQVVPFDFLPIDDEASMDNMYWGAGQSIIKGTRYVEKHPQLFGVYITNFSCGPDSFLITYFRDIMNRKPSLTLELDSHTADAGLETRIEAFLDIIKQYRHLLNKKIITTQPKTFVSAQTYLQNGIPLVKSSSGNVLSMKDPKVTLLIPSMGRLSTEAISAVFSHAGYHVAPHPPADEDVLKIGRANTSCKECLPLILTTGTLLNYIYTQKKPDEIVVYFMPTTSGPCRFGQYAIFMQQLIERMELQDVTIFALTSDNTYFGMGKGFNYYKAWWAMIVSDVMEDIRSMLLANSVDVDHALDIFEQNWQSILHTIQYGRYSDLIHQLDETINHLSHIPLKKPPALVPKILLTGEIFVRRDSLSRQNLTEWLAENGFAVICSPVSEWIRYSDYTIHADASWKKKPFSEKMRFLIRQWLMNIYEKRLGSTMSQSGLVSPRGVDIHHIIDIASHYLSPDLGGEAILTIGSSLDEIATHVCGVIAIGPFGCMPNRLSESILTDIMTRSSKLATKKSKILMEKVLSDIEELPFLAIESDGSPFPQLIIAKLEAFCQQALRLHLQMSAANK